MIESSNNPKFKHMKRLLESSSYRRKEGQFVLETPKLILEFSRLFPESIELILYDDLMPDTLLEFEHIQCSSLLLKELSSLESVSGTIALCRKPNVTIPDLAALSRIVVLDGVQDPKNLGAILRNAVAFGLDAVLMTTETVDLYHPGVIRAMAGAGFCIPVVERAEPALDTLEKLGYQYIVMDAQGTTPLEKLALPDKAAFVFGSEGQGVSEHWQKKQACVTCSIPINPTIDSLNVAVASGIMFYYCSK